MFRRKLLGFPYHSRAALGSGRENDLRTETAHDLASFDGKRIRHGRDERMPGGGADHCQRDAGITGRRLHDRLPRLQLSGFLRVIDDCEGEPILDRRHRIERFDFDVDLHVVRAHAIEAHDRCVADGLQNIVVDHPFYPCC